MNYESQAIQSKGRAIKEPPKSCRWEEKLRAGEIGISEKEIDRFWRLVQKRGEDECWEWIGTRPRKKYGHVKMSHRLQVKAHRFSYILHNGVIPRGFLICHTCDNPPCCNPGHLFIGTPKDNSHDRKNKGRSATGENSGFRKHRELYPRGEDCVKSVLTNSDVLEIRKLRSRGMTIIEIAKKFKITTPHVSQIYKRKIWKHI